MSTATAAPVVADERESEAPRTLVPPDSARHLPGDIVATSKGVDAALARIRAGLTVMEPSLLDSAAMRSQEVFALETILSGAADALADLSDGLVKVAAEVRDAIGQAVPPKPDAPKPEPDENEPWCEECGHRFSARIEVLTAELEPRFPPHEAIAYIDRLIADLRRGDGNGKPEPGSAPLPEWAHPGWLELREAVGALPHFPRGDHFDYMLEHFGDGLGDLIDLVTTDQDLLVRCRIATGYVEPTAVES